VERELLLARRILVILASCNTFRQFLNDLEEISPEYPILGMVRDITALLTNPPVPFGSERLKEVKYASFFNSLPAILQ
jgi:hypothetical protein